MIESFKKQERLCSVSLVNDLFSKAEKVLIYPFSIRFAFIENNKTEAKILIVCPKRYQKLAVNRNRIKRLMRESYRKNKAPLISFLNKNSVSLNFSISFISKDIVDYSFVDCKIQEILLEIMNRYPKKEEK